MIKQRDLVIGAILFVIYFITDCWLDSISAHNTEWITNVICAGGGVAFYFLLAAWKNKMQKKDKEIHFEE